MINRFIWALQRNKRDKDGIEHRRTVREVIDKRDAIHTALIDAERKETQGVAKYKEWVNALDWVLGARD